MIRYENNIPHYYIVKNQSSRILKSSLLLKVLIKDDYLAPTIDMDAKYSEIVTVKAGETLKLDAGIHGRPLPSVTWKKDEDVLESCSRIAFKTSDTSTSFEMQDLTRTDSGTYSISVKNTAGSRTLAIQVKVLDRPGPPAGTVEVTGITAESCVITWNPSSEDGGAPVSNYVVEKRETSHLAWVLVNPSVIVTSCKIGTVTYFHII